MSDVGLYNYNISPEELKENNERYEHAQEVLDSITPEMSDNDLTEAFIFGKRLFKARKNDKKIADLESMITLKAMTEMMKRKLPIADLQKRIDGGELCIS